LSLSFTPPTFGDIGKSASDLFKKKFDKKDFKNTVKVTNKTASGLILTTGGDIDKSAIAGSLKAKYAKPSFGEASGEVSTSGPAKAELKLKNLAKGLTVTLTGDTATKEEKFKCKTSSTTAPTGKLGVQYGYDFFTGTASYETSFFKTNILGGSAVVGFEGLSVGGEIKFDTAKFSDVEDYNVGAQYATSDYTGSLKTAKQGRELTAQYWHKVLPELQVGGQFNTELGDGDERSLGLATEYAVDKDTTFKLRGDTKGVLATAVEHRLSNPKLQVGLATSWQVNGWSSVKAKDFGIGLGFGDYAEDK